MREKSDGSIEPVLLNGEFVFPNQDRYNGEYQLNEEGVIERHGHGTQTTNQGIVYTGTWCNDKMEGQGHMTFPSGASYEGMFVGNHFSGEGTYTWPDGCFYKGSFEESRLKGEGIFCDKHQQVWTGNFHNKAAPGLKFKHNL